MTLGRIGTWVCALVLGLCISGEAAAKGNAAAITPFAQKGKLGIGLGGSNLVSGLTAKYYLDSRVAAQLSLGAWAGYGALVGLDGIYEMPQLFKQDALSINWHVGVGAAVGNYRDSSYNGVNVGASGIVGLGFQLTAIPIEVVLDIRPTFFYGTYWNYPFYAGGGGAIRFFF